ncbi:MAG: DMT family transporter [Myxococcota bacterium]
MKQHLDGQTVAAALTTLILWASAFPATRAALTTFAPLHLVLGRFLVASFCYASYLLWARPKGPQGRAWLAVGALGGLGISVYHTAFAAGLRTITAATASVVIVSVPVFSALIARFARDERLSTRAWLGIGVCFIGAAVIVLSRGGGLSLNIGALLILIAAIATSLYFVLQRPFTARIGPLAFTAYSTIMGTIPLLGFWPGFIEATTSAPPAQVAVVVYMGVFPSAIANMLWFYALERAPAGQVTSFIFLQPILVMIMAWAWLGEIPPLEAYIGGLFTIGGMALVTLKGRRDSAPSS